MVEYSPTWEDLPQDALQISQDVPVDKVRKSAVTLSSLLDERQEEQVLKEACLGLCQLFGDGIQNDRIQAILEANVVPKLVGLLRYSKTRSVPTSVQLAALQVLGNVACGDDQQTQVVIDSEALPCLRTLLSSSDRQIRKEVCWIVSNITESSHQVQDVLDADILPPLLKLLDNQDAACREDATWVLFNLSSNRVPKQIEYLAGKNGVRALCNLLTCQKELDVLWKGCGTVAAVALKGLRNILITGQQTASATSNGYNEMAALVAEAHGVERIEALTSHASVDVRNRARLILERMFGTEHSTGDIPQPFPSLSGSTFQNSSLHELPVSGGQASCSCDLSRLQVRQPYTNPTVSFRQAHGVYELKKELEQSKCSMPTLSRFSPDVVKHSSEHVHREASLVDIGSTSGSSTDSDPEDDDSDSDLIPPRPAPCCCLLCTDSSPLVERRHRSKGLLDESEFSRMGIKNSSEADHVRSICNFCSGGGRLGDGRAGLAAKLGRAVRLGHSHCLAILLSKMTWNQRGAATEAPSLLHPGGGLPDLGSGNSLPPVILAAQLGKPSCLGLLLQRCRPDLDVAYGKKRLTALAWAAHKGYLGCCKLLLEHGAKSWIKCGDGVTALHLAASGGFVTVCKLLLDNKAQVNSKSSKLQTPLCLAAQKGFTKTVKLLLEHGADPNNEDEGKYTPLHLAASNGFSPTVEILLNYGTPVDATTRNEVTPLHYAVQEGHSAVVKSLISAGANVNCNKKPLLLIAADDGKRDIVNLLLDAGASVGCRANIKAMLNKDIEICDYLTPLHLAASKNHHEVVEVLLRRGANVNELTLKSRWSALELAVLNGNSESAVKLLQHNAIVTDNCKNIGHKNWTLVQHAASSGSKDVVRLLIRRIQEQRSALSSSTDIDSTSTFIQSSSLPSNGVGFLAESLRQNGCSSTTYVAGDNGHTCSACTKLRKSAGICGSNSEKNAIDDVDQEQDHFDSGGVDCDKGLVNQSNCSLPSQDTLQHHQSHRKRAVRDDRQNCLRAREIRKREAEAREARDRLEEAISQRSVAKLTEAISHVSRLVLHLATSVGNENTSGRPEKGGGGVYNNEQYNYPGHALPSNQRAGTLTSSNACLVAAPPAMEVGLGNEVRKARKILASLQAEERRVREEKEKEAMDSKRENAQQTVKKAITTALEGGDPRSLSRTMNRATRSILDKDDSVVIEALSVLSLISKLEHQVRIVRTSTGAGDLESLTEALSETTDLVECLQNQGGMGTLIRVFDCAEPSKALAEAEITLVTMQENRKVEEARQLEAMCQEREMNVELSCAMKSDDIVRLEISLSKAQKALLSKDSQLSSTIEAAKKVMGRRLKAERRKLRQASNTNDSEIIEKAAAEAEAYGLHALHQDIELTKAYARKLRKQSAAVEDLERAISQSDVTSLGNLRVTLTSLGMFNEAETARSELEQLQRGIRARNLLQGAVNECQDALASMMEILTGPQEARQVMELLATWTWPDVQRLLDLSDRARQYGPVQYSLCESADELSQRLMDVGRRILAVCLESTDARAIAATVAEYEETFIRVPRCKEFQNEENLEAVKAAKQHLAHIQAIEQASIKAESAQVKVEYALATSRRSSARNRQCKGVLSKYGGQGRIGSSPPRSSHENANDPIGVSRMRSGSPTPSELVGNETLGSDSNSTRRVDKHDIQSILEREFSRPQNDRKLHQYQTDESTIHDSHKLFPLVSSECSHFYLFKEGTTVCCARCGNHRSSSNPEWLARVKKRGNKIPQDVMESSGSADVYLSHPQQKSHANRLQSNISLDIVRQSSPRSSNGSLSAQGSQQRSMADQSAHTRTSASMPDATLMMQMLQHHSSRQQMNSATMAVDHLRNMYASSTSNANAVHSTGISLATPRSSNFLDSTQTISARMNPLQDAMTYGISRNDLNLNPPTQANEMSISGAIGRQDLRVAHASSRMHDTPMLSEEHADGSRDLGLDFANENFGFDIDAIVDEPILPSSKTESRTGSILDADLSLYDTNRRDFFQR